MMVKADPIRLGFLASARVSRKNFSLKWYITIHRKNPVESISLLSTLLGNVPSLGGIQVLEICFKLYAVLLSFELLSTATRNFYFIAICRRCGSSWPCRPFCFFFLCCVYTGISAVAMTSGFTESSSNNPSPTHHIAPLARKNYWNSHLCRFWVKTLKRMTCMKFR